MKVKLKIFRFDPERDKEPHYDIFEVEATANDRLLDCLNKIRWEQDGSLAYRMSCAHGICGSDGMMINRQPTLACQKLVRDVDYTQEIVIEPLQFFPVIKDLVVDMTPFFERESSVHPQAGKSYETEGLDKEQLQSIANHATIEDDVKCIMCACCVSACPVNLSLDPAYVGPAAIVRAHRYIFDSRVKDSKVRLEIMDKPHGVWGCRNYWRCTEVCPKRIRVTEHILETKGKILEEIHPELLKQVRDNSV